MEVWYLGEENWSAGLQMEVHGSRVQDVPQFAKNKCYNTEYWNI